MKKITTDRTAKRKSRVSKNIRGTKDVPRISVFASNKYTYVQLIDDEDRKTLLSLSSLAFSQAPDYKKETKTQAAKQVGTELAKKIKAKGIVKAVFDRGAYAYKGRVKALAEGLREGGLII